MKELIELLRADIPGTITHQAADAIEQLRAERDELAAQVAVLRDALKMNTYDSDGRCVCCGRQDG